MVLHVPFKQQAVLLFELLQWEVWEREGEAPLWEGDYIHTGHLSSARAERAQMLN